MNIQQFQYVLAVAEHRHFAKAAEKCFISQSTLSTMIIKLEEELGINIFNRSEKPVGITKEGQKIIEQLKIITVEISRLNEICYELKGEIAGTLKIACIPTVAPFLLPLFMHEFARRYPELTLEVKELRSQDIIDMLKSRELDVGIVSTPIEERDLLEYPLYSEPFVLYDTSRIPTDKKDVRKLKMDNFWLLEEGHCMRDQVLEICGTDREESQPSQNIRFKAGSIGSLIRFVQSNKGKTLLPYLSILDLPVNEKQHITDFKQYRPTRDIGLLVHRHFVKEKALKQLKAEIVKSIKGISEEIRLL